MSDYVNQLERFDVTGKWSLLAINRSLTMQLKNYHIPYPYRHSRLGIPLDQALLSPIRYPRVDPYACEILGGALGAGCIKSLLVGELRPSHISRLSYFQLDESILWLI